MAMSRWRLWVLFPSLEELSSKRLDHVHPIKQCWLDWMLFSYSRHWLGESHEVSMYGVRCCLTMVVLHIGVGAHCFCHILASIRCLPCWSMCACFIVVLVEGCESYFISHLGRTTLDDDVLQLCWWFGSTLVLFAPILWRGWVLLKSTP